MVRSPWPGDPNPLVCLMSLRRKIKRRGQAPEQVLEIVYEPLPQGQRQPVSRELREELPRLHALMQDDPGAAVTELRAWIAREPNPMLFNWLGLAFGALDDIPAVEETIRENYRRNPQYLFARVNHAELCLRDGDLAGALEAFGGSFDLRRLIGGRNRVHVSEAAAYLYVVGLYHLKAGDLAEAQKTYEMLEEVAPGERATERLRQLLRPPLGDLFSRSR